MVNTGMGRHIRFPYPPRLTGSDLTRMLTSHMPSICRACYYIHVKIHFLTISLSITPQIHTLLSTVLGMAIQSDVANLDNSG